MKRMLMAIMAIVVAVAFSAPSFAGEGGDGKKDEGKKKGGGHVVVYGDEKKDDMKKGDKDKTKK